MKIWFLLAFQGGAINAGGFLSCHRFVSHTTGFATLFGAEAAHGNFLTALGMLSVPVFFLLGAMFSAFFVDRRKHHNQKPFYSLIMFFVFVILMVVWICSLGGSFGQFGSAANLDSDYLLLALLCLACGLQNAVITSASGAIVRTTHLTGITTDLGIGIIRMFSFDKDNTHVKKEARYNFVRAGIIASFALGSTVAGLIFYRYEYWGFALPTTTACYLWLYSRKQARKSPTTLMGTT